MIAVLDFIDKLLVCVTVASVIQVICFIDIMREHNKEKGRQWKLNI